MKQIAFEFKKLFSGKIKWILFVFLFVNALIYYIYLIPSIPTKQEIQVKKEWTEKLEKETNTIEEKIKILTLASEDIGKLSVYLSDESLLEEDEKEQIKEKYENTEYWNLETAMLVSRTFVQMKAEYQSVLDYQSFIGELQEKADKMAKIPIFAKKESFANKNIQKTAQDFKQMEDVDIEPVNGIGLEVFQNFYLSDIFMIIVIVLLCFQQFGQDNRTGMADLIQATPNGKGKLRFSQMSVIYLSVIGMTILLYGSNLVLSGVCFGWESTKRIQAIAVFRNVPFPLTIGAYAGLYLLGKILAIVFIATICQLLAVRWNGNNIAWVVFGGLLCISFSLWFFLPNSPISKIIQYLNLVGILDIKQILGSYQNLNLFSRPVSLLWAAIFFAVAVSLIGMLLILKIRRSERRIKKIEIARKGKHHVWKHVFYYEQNKIFWSQKIWLILIVLIGIGLSGWMKKDAFISSEEFYYNQYIALVEGAYTEEKNQIIQDLLSDPSITNTAQRNAIGQIHEQAENLKGQKHQNIAFLNENQIGKFLFDTENEMKNTLIVVVAMLLSVCTLFYQDKKTNMHHLLHTTPKANAIYWNKIKTAALIGAGYMSIIWGAYYTQYFVQYGIQNTDFLVQSLTKFGDMKVEITIWNYMIFNIIMRVFVGIYIGILLAFLAQVFVNPTQNMVIGTVILAFPFCLGMIGGMGYQNPLVSFINEKLTVIMKPVTMLTSFQCQWYQIGISSMILFLILPIILVIIGYQIWKRCK